MFPSGEDGREDNMFRSALVYRLGASGSAFRVSASPPDDQAKLLMSAPRSAPRLLAGTFELYRRYPSLFLVLTASVISVG